MLLLVVMKMQTKMSSKDVDGVFIKAFFVVDRGSASCFMRLLFEFLLGLGHLGSSGWSL